MGRSKRARKWGVSRLTFLPNTWWEYLEWAKEARTVVDQVIGGRPSPSIRALLNFIDQFIWESFGRWEYSLSPDIVEHTTSRFRKELEVIFDTIARRNSLRGKVPIFGLGASTSMRWRYWRFSIMIGSDLRDLTARLQRVRIRGQIVEGDQRELVGRQVEVVVAPV
jgi:hypothetical protein